MRAVTGAIVSSKPCSLPKAKGILSGFHNSSASNLPSSDAATYLVAAADAVNELREFRRDLLRALHQHQHQHQHEVKVGVADGDLVGSPAAARESKRRNKEEKRRVKQEEDVIQEEEVEEEKSKQGVAVVSKVGISLVPRKKEKHITIKQEEPEEEPEPEQHKKKAASQDKRRKHAAQELVEVKKEDVDFVDADLGSDKKKKKKKRSRVGDDDNGNAAGEAEVVLHTKKKQRK